MSRKSAAELAVGPILPGARPPPPADLEPEEQTTWLEITAGLPSEWFTACNLPMLKELCRHINYASWLARNNHPAAQAGGRSRPRSATPCVRMAFRPSASLTSRPSCA